MSDSPPKRIVITEERRAALRAEQTRTGRGAISVFGNDPDLPEGLRAQLVDNWITGRIRTAHGDYLRYVLGKWASLPEAPEKIQLTDERLAGLRAHIARTGVGVMRLLRDQDDVPEGLNATAFENWFKPSVKTARRDHVEYLEGKWKALDSVETVEITPALRQTLRAHKTRTGKGPRALLRGARDKPEGLRADAIQRWMSGNTRAARKDHLDYVLKRWAQARVAMPLDATLRRTLRAHIARTGVGSIALLRGARDMPEGLTPARIESWIHGTAKTALREHVDYVLRRWESLPPRSRD